MKVTTFARCLMPSKQRPAFVWFVDQALPHLLGTHNMMKTSALSCDNEIAMRSALENNFAWKKCTLRLDSFHLVLKEWFSLRISEKNDIDKAVIQNIYRWICSWLNYVELEGEFQVSLKEFKCSPIMKINHSSR